MLSPGKNPSRGVHCLAPDILVPLPASQPASQPQMHKRITWSSQTHTHTPTCGSTSDQRLSVSEPRMTTELQEFLVTAHTDSGVERSQYSFIGTIFQSLLTQSQREKREPLRAQKTRAGLPALSGKPGILQEAAGVWGTRGGNNQWEKSFPGCVHQGFDQVFGDQERGPRNAVSGCRACPLGVRGLPKLPAQKEDEQLSVAVVTLVCRPPGRAVCICWAPARAPRQMRREAGRRRWT